LISAVGGTRIISALGGLFTLMGVVQMRLDVLAGGPLLEILLELVLLIGPGVVLLYGGSWIRQSDLHQSLYPRIAVWCLGGLTVMAGITALLAFNPDDTLGHPLREAEFHMAVGSISGLAVGVMEARALSRAAETKEHEQALKESRDELETLIELLPVAVFVAEADGEIVKWNDAAEEIWGGEIVESESVAEYDQYEAWWGRHR
jgi:PAS domain-containing protein